MRQKYFSIKTKKALGAILFSAVLLSGCAGSGEKGTAEDGNDTLAVVQEKPCYCLHAEGYN